MNENVLVFVTVGSAEEGKKISQALIEDRLAACVSIIWPVTSTFRWEGDVCEETEGLLMIKTMSARMERIIHRVKELHSYETPEIIAMPVAGGSEEYLRWINGEVGSGSK